MTARTFLYPVTLLGAGSAEVESLSSYLCRLSAVHQVPIGVMLRLTYDWRSETTGSLEEPPYLARNPGTLAHYVRPTETTKSVLTLLSLATGEANLRCGTFMAIEAALDRCMRTFHNSIRWCPVCMAEFKAEGIEPHFKLVWSLASLERCPKHGVNLIETCPHCGALQCGFGLRQSCAACARCNKSLIPERHELVQPGPWRVESADLWRLLTRVGSNPDETFAAGGTKRALDELLDNAWRTDQAVELWKVVPRDELLAITCSDTPVTLTKVRRFAFKLGIDPTALLDGSVKETARTLHHSWSLRLPKSIRPRKRIERHDLTWLREKLDEEVRGIPAGVPCPLVGIARKLGVSTGCIRHHFPVHAFEILSRHKRWRRKEIERKQATAKAAVQRLLADPLHAAVASRKGAIRELRHRTNLPKDVLRKEVSRAFSAVEVRRTSRIKSERASETGK